ncbi:hypothetical protein SRIMM317S_06507 [Streptomyces rimosus subsp. rimosus]
MLRVLSYNVRSLRDDRAALARVIRACAPDLVFVQEAPRFFRWRKSVAKLCRATDLVYVTGGATAAGPMILSSLRAHVERTEDVLLPRTPGLHQRGFATAVVRVGGARLGLLSCHLSLQAAERHDQAGLLLERLRALDTPYAVAAGDLNDRPDGRAFRRLAGSLTDAWAAAPWGGEFTSTPPRPASAHRRGVHHRGRRGAGLRCAARAAGRQPRRPPRGDRPPAGAGRPPGPGRRVTPQDSRIRGSPRSLRPGPPPVQVSRLLGALSVPVKAYACRRQLRSANWPQ